MRHSFLPMLTTAMATMTVTTVVWAAPPKPTLYMQEQVAAVRALIKAPASAGTPEAADLDTKLKAVVDPVMEFERLAEKALAKHWPALTPDQKKTFIDTFRELVYRSYLKRVRSANDEYNVAYEGESLKGDKARVEAVAKTKKAEIELVFDLEAREDKRWVAADVVIDEVSLVENYRDQFNKIISESGFDTLISKMKKKLAEL